MKALISPSEKSSNGQRIAYVGEEFPVTDPMFWVDCPDSVVADSWYYHDGMFVNKFADQEQEEAKDQEIEVI